MDKEALRKQIYEELQSQYESRLRDAKKQKSQVEEELESSSEKWRSERRRLNSEIDRLEAALADSRERRKSSDTKATKTTDVVDTTKIQAAADEKLKKASKEWDTERSRLEGEVARLQSGVAELLERANNPLRAGQAAREQLQMRLDEALQMKRQTEDALLNAKAEWEKEKLKFTGDVIKARRSAGLKAPKEEPLEDPEVKKLTAQLEEARTKVSALESQLAKAKEAQTRVQELEAQVATIREAATKEIEALKSSQTTERDRQATQAAQTRIQELEAQVATIREAAAKEYAAQVERERRDTKQAREKLEKEIESLRSTLDTDRERQKVHAEESQKAHAQIRDLEQRLKETRDVPASSGKRIQELEAQVATIRDAAAREYADQIERERRDTKQAREKLEKEIESLRSVLDTDRERQKVHAEESQQAHARIRNLEQRLTETKGSAAKGQTEQLEKQLAEALSAKQIIERELQTRTEEFRRATARLSEAQTEVQQLERRLDETKDLVNAEAVEQLRRQYDERIQEMIRQKTQLSEQLNSASSLLETERSRFAAAAATAATKKSSEKTDEKKSPATTVDNETISAELARVEVKIAGIAELIDDPSTELSTVIRKNVERAELDAYLKGILFSLGKNRGL